MLGEKFHIFLVHSPNGWKSQLLARLKPGASTALRPSTGGQWPMPLGHPPLPSPVHQWRDGSETEELNGDATSIRHPKHELSPLYCDARSGHYIFFM